MSKLLIKCHILLVTISGALSVLPTTLLDNEHRIKKCEELKKQIEDTLKEIEKDVQKAYCQKLGGK